MFSESMDKLKRALTGREEEPDEERGFVAQVPERNVLIGRKTIGKKRNRQKYELSTKF